MKSKKDNTHNYGEIARVCKLRYSTTPLKVEKVLKPQPITKEDEQRVAKKLKNLVKTNGYRGYRSEEEYDSATYESKTRREIVFAHLDKKPWGPEGARVKEEIKQEYLNSMRFIKCDIVTPRKYNDQVDKDMKAKWSEFNEDYYQSFNNLWNKRMLYDGQLNVFTTEPTPINPKYNYLTNGTHYKGVCQEKRPSQNRSKALAIELRQEAQRASQDIMNVDTHIDTTPEFLGVLLNSDNDDENRYLNEEGLISVGSVRSLATNEGLQNAIRILSNLYANEADFSTIHLTELNVIRFVTSISIATSEARRYNSKIRKQKTRTLDELNDMLTGTSEKISGNANRYVREAYDNFHKDPRLVVLKVNKELTKRLNHTACSSVLSKEMTLFYYGLVLAALFKKLNRKVKNGK